MANTIFYNGVEWNLDYFVTATYFLEDNLGENPSEERVERVKLRWQAIEDHKDLKEAFDEQEQAKAEKPKKKRGRKKADKDESVPETPEG